MVKNNILENVKEINGKKNYEKYVTNICIIAL